MKVVAFVLAVLAGPADTSTPIGQVGGHPVYAQQVKGATADQRAESLRTLFIAPAMKAYLEPHRPQWTLTEPEIQQLIVAHHAASRCTSWKPPQTAEFDRMFAQMIGGNAKVQRFIYEHNGHGRVLFQQAGTEAFDATRTLLLRLEREGKFTITDPAMRAQAFAYWNRGQQPGLLPDPGPDKAFKLGEGLMTCPNEGAHIPKDSRTEKVP